MHTTFRNSNILIELRGPPVLKWYFFSAVLNIPCAVLGYTHTRVTQLVRAVTKVYSVCTTRIHSHKGHVAGGGRNQLKYVHVGKYANIFDYLPNIQTILKRLTPFIKIHTT